MTVGQAVSYNVVVHARNSGNPQVGPVNQSKRIQHPKEWEQPQVNLASWEHAAFSNGFTTDKNNKDYIVLRSNSSRALSSSSISPPQWDNDGALTIESDVRGVGKAAIVVRCRLGSLTTHPFL